MKPTKVYIAGKYSATNTIATLQNIGRGQHMASRLFSLGFAPYCPWHDRTFVMDNPDHHFDLQQFYQASLSWMECSDAVLVISGVGDGGGVDKEIKIARQLGIPVFYDIHNLLEWEANR